MACIGYNNVMITKQTLLEKRDAILRIAHRYGAHHVRVFGSVARGDVTQDSDLDLIVRFEPGRSLFDHGGLIVELEELLGVKVDVIGERGMRDRFRDRVTREAIPL
jgi:predicted nucleotidyltransferase